jgi:hypothetical protein
MNPLLAAILMPLSSVISLAIVGIGLRVRGGGVDRTSVSRLFRSECDRKPGAARGVNWAENFAGDWKPVAFNFKRSSFLCTGSNFPP